jgi:hypothetical protein
MWVRGHDTQADRCFAILVWNRLDLRSCDHNLIQAAADADGRIRNGVGLRMDARRKD